MSPLLPQNELLPIVCRALFLLPVIAILRYVLHAARNRLTTDVHKIPGPSISLRRFLVGYGLMPIMFRRDAVEVAELVTQWRNKYGPIIKSYAPLGRISIIASSPAAIRQITVSRQQFYHKTQLTRGTFSGIVGSEGILLAEGPTHTRLRRAVNPSMHHDAIVALGHVFIREGELLANRLANTNATPNRDLLSDVRVHTFRVILETCFGCDVVPAEVGIRLQDAYIETFVEPPSHVKRRLLLQTVFWFFPKKWFGWREDLKSYIRSAVYDLCDAKSLSSKPDCPEKALLSLIVDEETKKSIPRNQLVDTLLSFLVAGQATTSMSVCWLLYLLAREPTWQERVLREVTENWMEDDGLEALDQLPLLSCVIKECLRLYPPVYFITRETVQLETLDGFRIPKGTHIRVPVLALHRDPSIWGEDAAEFKPDRFLDKELVERTKLFWLPFVHGPRNCIGQRFAMLEIKAFVAQILLKQRLFIKPLEDPAPKSYGFFATPRGMKVYFETRGKVS